MEQDPEQNAIGTVLQEVQELRREISVMQRRMGLVGSEQSKSKQTLNVYFDKVDSERKPYVVVFGGILKAKLKLSPIRLAVFLAFLMDLEDRCSGGEGIGDIAKAIREALEVVDPSSREDQDLANGIRVASYRFENFIQGNKNLRNDNFRFAFNSKTNKCEIRNGEGVDVSESVRISASTNDGAIALLISKVLSGTPIDRLRKTGAMYVPDGPGGVDELLLKFYDHSDRLEVNSLYVRPPFTSYPTALLEYIGVPPKTIDRKRLTLNGLKEGRFKFTEILRRDVIWDLIRYSDKTGFKRYPPNVDASQVESHLDHLIYIIEEYENYRLFLTDAQPPFVVVTYRILRDLAPESYSVFFQPFSSAAGRDLGCFAISDHDVLRSINENIVEWVVSHPTTEREQSAVISLIKEVRTHLSEEGPLPLLID